MGEVKHPFWIAVDGPARSGKSTVARLVARRLELPCVETGAAYRGLALVAVRDRIRIDDHAGLAALVTGGRLAFAGGTAGPSVLLDGCDAGEDLRSAEVEAVAPLIAQVPQVRAVLTDLFRAIATRGPLVMEGRDIGTEVLPGADLKVFLDASEGERARRVYTERPSLARGGADAGAAVLERDRLDRTRAVGRLRPAEDALVIVTDSLTPDAVVDLIISQCYRGILLPRKSPGE